MTYRPFYKNAWRTFAKENPLWTTKLGKRYSGCQMKRVKDTLNASLKDFNVPTVIDTDCTGPSRVARAHWQVLVNTKQKESAKPSRNVHSWKPELRHHQQSFPLQICLFVSSISSLDLRLVSIVSKVSRIWLRLAIVSNYRRTIVADMHTSHFVKTCLLLWMPIWYLTNSKYTKTYVFS